MRSCLFFLPWLAACAGAADDLATTPRTTSSTEPAVALATVLGDEAIEVPIEVLDAHHLLVEVDSTLGPLWFVVDSGASVTILDTALAGSEPTVGGVPIDPFLVDDLELELDGIAVDGILGAPFLVGHRALIDYTAPSLFLPGEGTGRAVRDHLEEIGYARVPFALEPTIAFITLDGEVNGQGGLHTIVDTGARTSAVELAAATALDLELRPVEDGVSTIDGPVGTWETTLAAWSVDDVALPPRDVAVIDLSNVNGQLAGIGIDPIEVLVGGDLLAEAEAVVDYAGERLFLRLPATSP